MRPPGAQCVPEDTCVNPKGLTYPTVSFLPFNRPLPVWILRSILHHVSDADCVCAAELENLLLGLESLECTREIVSHGYSSKATIRAIMHPAITAVMGTLQNKQQLPIPHNQARQRTSDITDTCNRHGA